MTCGYLVAALLAYGSLPRRCSCGPTGSMYTSIMELGPSSHDKDGLLGAYFHKGSIHGASRGYV